MSAAVPLFTPLKLRNLTLRNRIGVSPMCQYSAVEGMSGDWHLVHLGSRAIGGAGLVMMEATGVTPEGRITPDCSGIWSDAHIEPLKRITGFIAEHGAAPALQLAHAGRKASMAAPWKGGKRLSASEGGWQTVSASAVPFTPDLAPPREMSADDIKKLIDAFVAGARRGVAAGFPILEIHGAHGYLLHQFLSPLSNFRTDDYGGSEENRFRLIREVARAVRAEVPSDTVVGARLSCTDWDEKGLTIKDTARLSALLKEDGLDFIDCSSGFVTADAKVPFAPGFQVPFATEIRETAKLPAFAVGLITEAAQANDIIAKEQADMVLLARAELRDPYWPLHAALELGIAPVDANVPAQYLRGFQENRTAAPRKKAG
ncbi:MAG: oxidoreductase [Alphaproteobacteria bacterium]|nr:oxidoreductase [Alphaproteobacteria bacterium]